MTTYYLQHGKAGEPMRTERVEHKIAPAKTAIAEQNPKELWLITDIKLRVEGSWRRVYQYNPQGNQKDKGSLFIGRSVNTGIHFDHGSCRTTGIRVLKHDEVGKTNANYIEAQLSEIGWLRPAGGAGNALIQLRSYEGKSTNWLSIDSTAWTKIRAALLDMAARKDRQEGAT